MRRCGVWWLFLLALQFDLVAAESMRREIVLSNNAGEAIVIGHLLLTPEAGRYRTQVVLDDTRFADHFLSMRPFKCLEGSEQLLCHLPYPYQNQQLISPDDLTDLEYQLLFIRKAPNDYGINPWFGVYYRLQWENPPSGPISGQLFETDMDVLAAPPDDPSVRPITPDDLYEAAPGVHWLPRILMR
jgi:hypothetical protein